MWSRALERTHRAERGRVLASLIRWCGDFQMAEDALQDAMAAAAESWRRDGVPDRPAAWLTVAARRRILDRLKHERTRARQHPTLLAEAELEQSVDLSSSQDGFSDERLRLIFTCCHPALSSEAQVALTLHTLGGMTTKEIAKAFLLEERAMSQRLVRAKQKIARAGIPFEVPGPRHWGDRVEGVLRTVYLIFNEGYMSSHGDSLLRRELSFEGLRLGHVLFRLLPEEPEVEGLLALMMLHESRRKARTDAAGELVCLDVQDRSKWDQELIAEGIRRVSAALARGPVGPYQIQAAIAAVHAEAARYEDTDWAQIALLYDLLYERWPSPVIDLNRAVSYGMLQGPDEGLRRLEGVASALGQYVAFHLAKADFLERRGDRPGADAAYAEAHRLAENEAVRRHIERRRNAPPELRSPRPSPSRQPGAEPPTSPRVSSSSGRRTN